MSKRRKDSEQTRGAMQEMTGDTSVANPDRERIARRAYELFQARGGGEGRADEDWYAAERELSRGNRREES